MKRLGILLISIVLLGSLGAGFSGSGSGTQSDPFQVTTWGELQEMNGDLDAYYKLMNDLSNTTSGYDTYAGSSANGGSGWNPTGTFSGSFDGSSYVVSDLYIDRGSMNSVGLFGETGSGANITGVGVENVNITGYEGVGGLIGANDGSVSSSYVTGSVSGSGYVGGLIGFNYGSVSSSYVTGSVSGSGSQVGGLIGTNDGGSVEDSYSTASASSGSGEVGGLVGKNNGGVSRCYSTGSVSSSWATGGLIGYNPGGSVSDSFWDTETSGQSSSDGGTGKTTSEMQTLSTFTDTGTSGLSSSWDFIGTYNDDSGNDDLWGFESSESYPELTAFNTDLTSNFPPSYSDFQVTSPNNYADVETNISINWSDENFNVSTLEHNLTGTSQNVTGVSSYSSVVGAGSYYVKFYGEDEFGEKTTTDKKNFTIDKASPVVNITFSDGTGSVTNGNFTIASDETLYVNATTTAISSQVDTGNFKLWKNGSSIGSLTGSTLSYSNSSLEPGTYYFNSSYLGNANYTSFIRDPKVTVTESNNPPSMTLNQPLDGATETGLSPTLNITATDPDGDTMNVTFYNSSGQSLCNKTNIPDGSTATCNWTDLTENSTYEWYVNVSDGEYTNQSSTWNFTTDYDYPTPTNFTINNPTTYNPNTNTNITVDWIDLSTVNTTVTLRNTGENTTSNYTENVTTPLAAGNYTIKTTGEDEYGFTNSTQKNITIDKASTTIDIKFETSEQEVTNGNITIESDVGINVTSSLSSGNSVLDTGQVDSNFELYRDGSSVGSFSSGSVLEYIVGSFDPGVYYFNSSFTGNENYSAFTRDPAVIVEQASVGGGGGGGPVGDSTFEAEGLFTVEPGDPLTGVDTCRDYVVTADEDLESYIDVGVKGSGEVVVDDTELDVSSWITPSGKGFDLEPGGSKEFQACVDVPEEYRDKVTGEIGEVEVYTGGMSVGIPVEVTGYGGAAVFGDVASEISGLDYRFVLFAGFLILGVVLVLLIARY